jgi:hypothetical protein
MRDALGDPRVIVMLREPVSRFVSFFEYQKVRLRLPETMTIEEYLAASGDMTLADFADPDNERYFGFRGGCYADFLPAWTATYGAQLRILFLDDLIARPDETLRDLAHWLQIDPEGYQATSTDSENRTVGFKNRRLQRLALFVNDGAERFLRRHHGLKQRLRALYYRVNGQSKREAVPQEVARELRSRYREPNERLAEQLRSAGTAIPEWLRTSTPVTG